jgi:multidrug efflux pump subunit AcrB
VTYALVRGSLPMDGLRAIALRRLAPQLQAVDGVLKASVVGGGSGADASVYRYNGQEAVAVAVVKRANANTLDIADACEKVVAAFRAANPALRVERTSEQATFIREATQATTEALGLAVVLAVVVILAFLRDWRATTISAIAIPVSLLGTAIVMWALHFNLETITLLALALVVGVIVDDAIVAVENIVRHLEAGETPMNAALHANKEIGLTLVAASFTIVAVFLPIGLMQGSLGQFFRAFGITASAAVLFSLLAARTLSPAIAAWWLRARPAARGGARGPVDVDHSTAHPGYRR